MEDVWDEKPVDIEKLFLLADHKRAYSIKSGKAFIHQINRIKRSRKDVLTDTQSDQDVLLPLTIVSHGFISGLKRGS